MKPFNFASSMLTIMLTLGMPTIVLGHVGHGDEFKAQGKAQRVQVNPETDKMLGITTAPVTAGSGTSMLMPATALVEADGKKWTFVKFENFYEPVEVVTGATKGDQIEVTQGLSVGDQLVTQGGLSLYSEALKAKGKPEVAAAPSSASAADQTAATAHAQAHAAGAAHSHDQAGFPMKRYALLAGGAIVVLGGAAFAANRLRKVD